MNKDAPRTIVLAPDDYHVRHVGHTEDGRQFFLTTPFVPAFERDGGREFLALYIFDAQGKALEARIDDLGARAELDEEHARRLHEQQLNELGRVRIAPFRVQPFSLDRFGTTFGLVLHPPEDDDDHWSVTAEPGNYFAFYPPWDGGYDT